MTLTTKRVRDLTLDLILTLGSGLVSLELVRNRLDFFNPSPSDWAMVIGVAFAHVALMRLCGVYSLRVRYIGFRDAFLIGFTAVLPGALLVALEWPHMAQPSSKRLILLVLLYCFFSSSLLVLIRLAKRQIQLSMQAASKRPNEQPRTLVVGAGDAGEAIVREMNRRMTANIVGFIDDDPEKRSIRIHGIPVLGNVEDIPACVKKQGITQILVTMPAASGAAMRRIYKICSETQARVRTLPGLGELLTGNSALTTQLREVRIEDLLRREPVETDLAEVSKYISGRRILITGGGGSIGGELARQVARLNPSLLILVGKGENSIYEIEQELKQTHNIQPICIIADVRDTNAIDRIFKEHRPQVVFHAAAHKHVPLMQANIEEAVRNNVLGTLNVASTAVRYEVQRFILISTDKAVRPSSIMGATKRVCERIISAYGSSTKTTFAAVRFGNVLGSRGSLVPLLTAQLRRGGPLTVTHPHATRYFMTIPEAVQLVLQTGSMGTHGEIFILDMGEPVRIMDLAIELVRLHGLVPNEDVNIEVVGLRPGEKLHEELVYDLSELAATAHPKIMKVARGDSISIEKLEMQITELVKLASSSDKESAKDFLMEMASGGLDKSVRDLMAAENLFDEKELPLGTSYPVV